MAKRNSRNNKSRSDSRNNNRDYKRKGKEFELNMPDGSINKEDLNVIFRKKGANDISWYSNNPQMLKDVASLPFGNPAGVAFSRVKPNATSVAENNNLVDASVPGIMVLNFQPTLGLPKSPIDPLNLAAQQIYSIDRAANSGAANYDRADVMLMIAGMDSAYILYEHFVRVYKLLRKTDYTNRFRPDALVRALGFNPDKLRSNMADFRYQINNFAYALASVNVPDQFDFIHRHSWMCSNVYKDANEVKAQYYAFVPTAVYVYTEGADSKATHLAMTTLSELCGRAFPSSGYELQDIVNMMNAVIKPILGSADLGNVSGDLAKAMGEGGMIKIQPIAEFDEIEPIYNEEVLLQIQNADICGQVRLSTVTQYLEDLSSGPYLVENASIVATSDLSSWRAISDMTHVMSLPSDSPTPDLSMIASRFMSHISVSGANTGMIYSLGSEILTSIQVYNLLNGVLHLVTQKSGNFIVLPKDASNSTALYDIAAISKFDYAPWFALLYDPGEDPGAPANRVYEGDLFDYRNYTLVADSSVDDLNEVAVSSLFRAKNFGSKF